ncbi:hypothetical protein K6L44_06665 [Gluconacetobacter entanii]|uniref:hypothetical protein n=1 Tax=Gluconacetobacter entanii TaxID=108528 RepID=UPI001C9365FF|nr:hypothetical protein [Gluconacetobacter entanii]MBY4639684.1 hypothetical protein [Gluconacetobacter entanii]MCW4579190.1 hypothetical protein [Gluconacetobacter entanii]MCW4582580.1 hypothetical protein [Gluconacetobacter entanii]MCW4585971.1 hypothetical protein [Gluconacetobacter entanii]
MIILTSDAAEPVEIPDADQPYEWPIWLYKVAAIADRSGVHNLNAVHVEALRPAWRAGEAPQDAYQRVIGVDYVEF